MAYKKVLSKVIKASGLSLRDISDKCNTYGVNVSSSYLSQLQTGKLPPPSEQVSLAIAHICGLNDPTELIFEAYMEKAPEIVKYYLNATSEVNRQLLKELHLGLGKTVSEEYYEYLNIFSSMGSTISYLEKLKRQYKTRKLLDAYDFIKTELTEKYEFDEMSNVFIQDSAMEPLIPKNSRLHCDIINYKSYVEKDIIAIKTGKIITARRYYKHNNRVTLVPDNKEYGILYCDNLTEIEHYGKVISYTASVK